VSIGEAWFGGIQLSEVLLERAKARERLAHRIGAGASSPVLVSGLLSNRRVGGTGQSTDGEM
jgi:hypothetical protein